MKYALSLAPSDEALKKEHDKVRTDLIKAGHKASDLDALPPPDPPAGAPAQSTSPTAGTAGSAMLAAGGYGNGTGSI